MRIGIDLNEREIDLNECEHFLKANFRSKSEVDPTCTDPSVKGRN